MKTQYPPNIYGKILRKWDKWIYQVSFKTLRRMTLDNPGLSYLMELNLRGWNDQLNIPDSLKRATESFVDSLRDVDNANK